MAKNGTKNGLNQVEAEQGSYYREYPVAFGQKREIVGVGQSDTASNYFQVNNGVLYYLDLLKISTSGSSLFFRFNP